MLDTAAAGWPRDWARRLGLLLGHYDYELFLLTVAAIAASQVVGRLPVHGNGPFNTAQWVGGGLGLLATVAMLCNLTLHRDGCPRDFTPATLLNPDRAVRRNRHLLAYYHNTKAAIAQAAAWMVMITGFSGRRPLWILPVFAAVMLWMAYTCWAGRAHRRLADFCPHCHQPQPATDVQRLHHYRRLGNLGQVLIIGAGSTQLWFTHGWLSTTLGITYGIGIATLIVSVAMLALHDQGICTRCAEELPLDPQAAVQRHLRSFRIMHTVGSTWRRLFTTLAVIFAVPLLPAWLLPTGWRHWTGPALLLFCGVVITAIYRTFAAHQQLQLWCPWCHPGRPGDDEEQPDPVLPDPATADAR